MRNLWLTFKSTLIENKYRAFKRESYRPLILVLLALFIVMTIYILSSEPARGVEDDVLMWIYLGIAIVSFICYKKLPKVQYLVILVSGLLLYFVRINIRLENILDISRENLAMKGYNWALLYMIIQLHLPHFKYVVAFELAAWVIRISLFHSDFFVEILVFQIISSIYILFIRYMMERKDRLQFLEVTKFIDHLAKFKQLINSQIPSAILVLENSSKMTPLFLNDLFKKYLNNDESEKAINNFLKSVKHDKEHLESQTSDSQNEIPSLFDTIENVVYELGAKSDSIKSFGTCFDDNKQKSTFEVSLLKLPWDGTEAIVVVLNDMTVQESIITLKASNKNKEEVIGIVSHELRTPLAGIIGILQIMESMCSFNQELRKCIGICQTNANILLSFLNCILDLQQIRANTLKLNISKINIFKLLNEIKLMFDFQCSFKNIEYRLDIDTNVPENIYCDRERLTQILINLSGNALKFTFQGSITLGVTKDSNDDNSIIFSVIDTGVGIKAEDQERLFKAFSKLEDKEGINKKGVGLGLMISNTLAKSLNKLNEGIQVESELNKGTKFSFSVPIYLDKKRGREDSNNDSIADEKQVDLLIRPIVSPREPNDNLLKMTLSPNLTSREGNLISRSNSLVKSQNVILVDDNAFNIMIAEKLIEKQKIKVKKAYNGQEAIDLTKSLHSQGETIGLIFMDCHMPIMDGYEATGILRSLMKKGELPYIPIIALSANNYEQDVKKSLNSGMDDHMSKPLNEHDLVRILDKYNSNKA